MGGRGQVTVSKSLLVLDPLLFSRRDRRGRVTEEPSPTMLVQASERYRRVVVLPVFGKISLIRKLRDFVEELRIDNIDVRDVKCDLFTMTELVKEVALELGATIRKVDNPRELSVMSVNRYLEGDSVVAVYREDWRKAGIELDKDKSFADFEKERSSHSIW